MSSMGIAAVGNSSFFVHNTHYVFSDLKTWGWITLVLGILEIGASLSLVGGGGYGRGFATVNRLSVANPWWRTPYAPPGGVALTV